VARKARTPTNPMITSKVPNPNNADVYNEYAKLAVCHDDGGGYKLDEYLRLVRPDGDESRIESLLEMIFEIKTTDDKENLTQALRKDTLKSSLHLLENADVSPSTSLQHVKVSQRYSPTARKESSNSDDPNTDDDPPLGIHSSVSVISSDAPVLSLRRMRS
jgi:hypothetical protein